MLAGARCVATDALTALGPERVSLVWVNSPSNPTGRVLPVEHLRKVVAWCRERGALLVSDECYIECAWETADGGRSRCCTPTSATATTPASSPCTRCRSAPTWPATGPRSSPATPRSSASCSRCARTSACRCPARSRSRWRWRSTTTSTSRSSSTRYAERRKRLQARLRAGRLPHRPLRGVALPVGDARRVVLGHGGGSGRPRHPGGAGDFYGRAGAEHVRIAFTATDERVDAAVERLA